MFNLQTALGLLVTAGIVWVGLTRIDLSETVAAFAVVRVGFVLAGGALIVVVIAIFAVRWRVLLPNRPDVPVRFVFCYLMIGYMVNAIIPLRLGDLVRAYLLGRRHGIAVSTTLSTVVVERIFDVVAIVIIGLLISTVLALPPLVESVCARSHSSVWPGCHCSTGFPSGTNGPSGSPGSKPTPVVRGGLARRCGGWSISAARSPCCTTGSV
jgi:hypothetical protein